MDNLLYKLKLNPSNPRLITKDQYDKLKQSLKEFVEMLEVREIVYDGDFIIWGGNQRFQAYKMLVEDKILEYNDKYFRKMPSHWTEFQKKQFAIKDNSPKGISGEWDHDILANEWDDLPLEEWGLLKTWNYEDVDVKKLWEENGMPDYGDPTSKVAFRSIIVHFKNNDEVEAFKNLLNLDITDKSKFIWFR